MDKIIFKGMFDGVKTIDKQDKDELIKKLDKLGETLKKQREILERIKAELN